MKPSNLALLLLFLCTASGAAGYVLASRNVAAITRGQEVALQRHGDSIRIFLSGQARATEDSLRLKYRVDTLWRRRTIVRVDSIAATIDTSATMVPTTRVVALIAAAREADSACAATIATCEARAAHAEAARDSAIVLAQIESTRVVVAKVNEQNSLKSLSRERWKLRIMAVIAILAVALKQ